MKIKLVKYTAGSINPAFFRATVLIMAVISIMAGPLTARANRISVLSGREPSELMCNSIATGGQEKESKQEEKAGPVTAPKVTFNGPQPYPEQALSERITGTVKLRLLIKADGSWELDKVLLEEPEDYGFAEAAIKYLGQSTWTPATRDGKPFDAQFTLAIVFQPPPDKPSEDTSIQNESETKESEPSDNNRNNLESRVLAKGPMPYPWKARLKGIGGKVRLRVIIRADGSYVVVKILDEEPEGYGFGKAAIQYLKKCVMQPARKDGDPIDTISEITIHFDPEKIVAPKPGEVNSAQDWETLEIDGIIDDIEYTIDDVGIGPILFAGVGGKIPEPELLHRIEPDYPEAARRARVDGFVLLEAIVNKTGDVVNIKVLEAPPARYGFAKKAVEAVSKWKFKPSIYKGKPVPVRIRFSVEFNLVY